MLKILLFCWLSSSLSDAANILGVWPVASRSHYSLGLALFEELAVNGHNVSYLILNYCQNNNECLLLIQR